jgi:hypothetical protein
MNADFILVLLLLVLAVRRRFSAIRTTHYLPLPLPEMAGKWQVNES